MKEKVARSTSTCTHGQHSQQATRAEGRLKMTNLAFFLTYYADDNVEFSLRADHGLQVYHQSAFICSVRSHWSSHSRISCC